MARIVRSGQGLRLTYGAAAVLFVMAVAVSLEGVGATGTEDDARMRRLIQKVQNNLEKLGHEEEDGRATEGYRSNWVPAPTNGESGAGAVRTHKHRQAARGRRVPNRRHAFAPRRRETRGKTNGEAERRVDHRRFHRVPTNSMAQARSKKGLLGNIGGALGGAAQAVGGIAAQAAPLAMGAAGLAGAAGMMGGMGGGAPGMPGMPPMGGMMGGMPPSSCGGGCGASGCNPCRVMATVRHMQARESTDNQMMNMQLNELMDQLRMGESRVRHLDSDVLRLWNELNMQKQEFQEDSRMSRMGEGMPGMGADGGEGDAMTKMMQNMMMMKMMKAAMKEDPVNPMMNPMGPYGQSPYGQSPYGQSPYGAPPGMMHPSQLPPGHPARQAHEDDSLNKMIMLMMALNEKKKLGAMQNGDTNGSTLPVRPNEKQAFATAALRNPAIRREVEKLHRQLQHSLRSRAAHLGARVRRHHTRGGAPQPSLMDLNEELNQADTYANGAADKDWDAYDYTSDDSDSLRRLDEAQADDMNGDYPPAPTNGDDPTGERAAAAAVDKDAAAAGLRPRIEADLARTNQDLTEMVNHHVIPSPYDFTPPVVSTNDDDDTDAAEADDSDAGDLADEADASAADDDSADGADDTDDDADVDDGASTDLQEATAQADAGPAGPADPTNLQQESG